MGFGYCRTGAKAAEYPDTVFRLACSDIQIQ